MAPEKVSVIIPVFNAAPVLDSAIQSVLTQEYNNIELIIIDGGSTDGTVELLKKYHSCIAYWVSEPDRGVYGAMNKGIAAATGDWLFFLGADDILCPGIISCIFKQFFFAGADLIYGKVRNQTKQIEIGREMIPELLIEENIPHQGIFYNKRIFDSLKGYNERYKILADYDLNLKIFEDTTLKKIYTDQVVSYISNKGLSHRTIDLQFFVDRKYYYLKVKMIHRTDQRIAQYYFFYGMGQSLKKNYWTGLKNIIHGIIFGKLRLRYFLITMDCLCGKLGIRQKYKIPKEYK